MRDPRRALQAFDGVVEQADAAALADRAGPYACPHIGVALAVAGKLARRGVIQPSGKCLARSRHLPLNRDAG